VSATIARTKQQLASAREAEMESQREEALAEYDAIKREAWERLAQCQANSTAAVGYLGAILGARAAQDRLLGLDEITINHRGVYLARIEAILNSPVPLTLPGASTHD